MKLIIDISEEVYNDIKEGFYDKNLRKMAIAIGNGISLPKGHGRLIDADDLKLDIIAHKYSNSFCEEHNIDQSINVGMLNILLSDAPTIVEADEGKFNKINEKAKELLNKSTKTTEEVFLNIRINIDKEIAYSIRENPEAREYRSGLITALQIIYEEMSRA